MHTSFLKVAGPGWPFILGGLVVAGMACGAGAYWHLRHIHIYPVAGLALLFSCFCVYFFRDPERPLPADPARIYSPGDGTVLSVAKEGPGDVTTIRIFLSIFNVHIQRLPVSGTVEMVRYQEGSFKAAMKDGAKENERSIIRVAVEGREDKVTFEQIAGLVARRIRYWVGEGDKAVQGERYGLIQFGSQAAVHIPGSARPLVVPGDRAVGGVTPIAEWINKD